MALLPFLRMLTGVSLEDDKMSWTEWFHMVTSARDMRIKALLSAYLFMWTCNRAIRILGEGTVAEKVQVLTNSNKGISVIWKAQLQNRLGCAYRSIRNIVEDGEMSNGRKSTLLRLSRSRELRMVLNLMLRMILRT